MIHITLIDNQQSCHKDLNFKVDGLTEQLTFDSYYFAVAAEQKSVQISTAQAIGQLIKFWIDKLELLENNKVIFLPIDFSDQYIGCIKVTNINGELDLNYGYTRTEGFAVNPLNPENFFNNVIDFVSEPNELHLNHRDLLINSLISEYNRL